MSKKIFSITIFNIRKSFSNVILKKKSIKKALGCLRKSA